MARRKKSTPLFTPSKIIVIAIIIAGCLFISRSKASTDDNHPGQPAETESNANFGYLLDVKIPAETPSFWKQYRGMDISFNPEAHIPNYVAWELTAEEADGKEPRANSFRADSDVEGCAETWDYSYSGYDRGHMAPAGDMKWDKKAMEETFYLTNIAPQDKALNTGAWRTREEKCRVWARSLGHIYIVCGPVIDGNPEEYIGDTRVYVPRKFFKVVIAPDAPQPMGIGFIMPNSKVEGGMQKAAVTIDSVESLTGFDFFHSLPDELERDIESQCNFNRWATLTKSK